MRMQSRTTASQNVGMPKSCCKWGLYLRAVDSLIGAQDRT